MPVPYPPYSKDLKHLTPQQYQVTQQCGTEPPFQNAYWNNHEDGIYVDVASGEPLFSSLDKFDSGTGWPSFTRPIEDQDVAYKKDRELGYERTEVKSKVANSHLGHVFDDGPGPTQKRYCINSAALRFIPAEKLQAEGYGKYAFPFAAKKGWETATLGGGCFWGVEHLLRGLPGVIAAQVGYAGGKTQSPTYNDVKGGDTQHAESVQLLFDPKKLSYEEILLFFFKIHDPTTVDQQGNDAGAQYRSVIFYASQKQQETAEKVKKRVDASHAWKKPIVTQIAPAGRFWRAEEYHQDYLEKHPDGYTCHFIRKVEF